MLDTSDVKKIAGIRSCPGPPLAARFEVLVSPTRPRTMITASRSLPGQGVGFLDVRVAIAICRTTPAETKNVSPLWQNHIFSLANDGVTIVDRRGTMPAGQRSATSIESFQRPRCARQYLVVGPSMGPVSRLGRLLRAGARWHTVRWTTPPRCVLKVEHDRIYA